MYKIYVSDEVFFPRCNFCCDTWTSFFFSNSIATIVKEPNSLNKIMQLINCN